jgi:hypothetical protein
MGDGTRLGLDHGAHLSAFLLAKQIRRIHDSRASRDERLEELVELERWILGHDPGMLYAVETAIAVSLDQGITESVVLEWYAEFVWSLPKEWLERASAHLLTRFFRVLEAVTVRIRLIEVILLLDYQQNHDPRASSVVAMVESPALVLASGPDGDAARQIASALVRQIAVAPAHQLREHGSNVFALYVANVLKLTLGGTNRPVEYAIIDRALQNATMLGDDRREDLVRLLELEPERR